MFLFLHLFNMFDIISRAKVKSTTAKQKQRLKQMPGTLSGLHGAVLSYEKIKSSRTR